MNAHKPRWQLKNMAKDKLRGNYSEAVLITFLYGLFLIAANVLDTFVMCSFSESDNPLLSVLLADITPTGYLLSIGISVLTGILLNLLKAGMNLFYLNLACGQQYSMKDLLHAFRNQPGKFALISLVLVLIQFFCSLPGYACNYFYLLNPSEQWMSLFYICSFVGQLVALPAVLGLSQCLRLLLDYPSLTASEALRKGWQLMNGHKARLFVLMLSFVPLQIVTAFTLGIGYLWLTPYMTLTYTLFYLDLMENQNL